MSTAVAERSTVETSVLDQTLTPSDMVQATLNHIGQLEMIYRNAQTSCAQAKDGQGAMDQSKCHVVAMRLREDLTLAIRRHNAPMPVAGFAQMMTAAADKIGAATLIIEPLRLIRLGRQSALTGKIDKARMSG